MDQELVQVILGLKLKYLMNRKSMSLKSLSDSCGISSSYLNEIEKGKKYPKPEKMLALAHALDVPYDMLVSTQMDGEQMPLAALLEAPLLRKFPFHIFGISARELLQLMAGHPQKMSVLVQMLSELGRNYDMRMEHFFHTALRCYQLIHHNYFDDLEQLVLEFRRDHGLDEDDLLRYDEVATILARRFGYSFDFQRLAQHDDLGQIRTALAPGPMLLMHASLSPAQRAFAVAREIGYHLIGPGERAKCSPAQEVRTFEQVFNDFRASYFASALLVPTRNLVTDLKRIFGLGHWDPGAFLELLQRYATTPEMLFYRFSEVIPKYFPAKRLHFMRFSKTSGQALATLDKQLNMSRVHVPSGIELRENFCRRWLSVSILDRMEQARSAGPLIGAQRSGFLDYESEFFCIAVAYRNSLDPKRISSVTIGFQVDRNLKRTVRFWADPKIVSKMLGQTCERCSLTKEECSERAAPASIYRQEKSKNQRLDKLARLLSDAAR